MKRYFLFIAMSFWSYSGFCSLSGSMPDDVFIIFYATYNGKTGHIGIAIDNYRFRNIEGIFNGESRNRYDTISTGKLTYFDLWPLKDNLPRSMAGKDIEAKYCKLPAASWEKEINLHTLYFDGIPQNKGYPCDGIIRFKTAPWQDYQMLHFLDSLIQANRPFNTRKYNCADFVEEAVEYLTGKNLSADELVLFKYSTTPNRLFKAIVKLKETKLIKNPGKKVNGTFWKERVLGRIPLFGNQ